MSAPRGRSKVWIVREGDGATLRDVLKRAGEATSAVGEGRVFVGRVRATKADVKVRPGDEVTIGPPAEKAPPVHVLLREDGLCAVAKTAGLPTVPDHAGAAHSLVGRLASQLRIDAGSLRVTSRLDREVSGVVVLAETEEAERRLKDARERGLYARRYVALADARRVKLPESGVWDAPIGRGFDARHRRANGPEAKPSLTRFRVVARTGGVMLLAVAPETGRTHQIRVHASHARSPLLGDRDYGGEPRLVLPDGSVMALDRISLHCARVTVPRGSGEPVVVDAPIPDAVTSIWRALGGSAEAWDTARTCVVDDSSPSVSS